MRCRSSPAWPSLRARPSLPLSADHGIPALRVTQIFCAAGVLWAPFWTCMNMALAMGRPGVYLRAEIIFLTATIIAVLGSSTFGLNAVAWGLCGVVLIACLYCMYVQRVLADVSLRDMAQASMKSLILAAAAASGTLISEFLLPAAASVPLRLGLGGTLALLGWWLALVATNHPLKGEAARVLDYVRELGRSGRP